MNKTKMYSFYYRKRKRNYKLPVIIIAGILVCIAILWAIFSFFISREDKIYAAKSYYMISLFSDKNKKRIQNLENDVTNVGGAGYIFFKDNIYYIFAFGYLNRQDAQKVLEDVKPSFEEAEIVEVKLETIKKKRRLKNNSISKLIYEYVCGLASSIYELVIYYDEGWETSKIYRELEKVNMKLSEYISLLEKDKSKDEIIEMLLINTKVCLGLLNSCKDDIYKSSSPSIKLKSLFLKLVVEEKALRENLNNA